MKIQSGYLFILIIFLSAFEVSFAQKPNSKNAASGLSSAGASDNQFEISKNLDIYVSVMKELNYLYVEDFNPADLVKTSINAMLRSLDPYTVFYPESDAEDVKFMTTGSYGGIGAMIGKNGDYVQITEPYQGFPADKAGLMAGDIILEIDGKSAKGMSTEDVTTLLKGQPNTKVTLLIDRYGKPEPIKVEIVRGIVKIENVPYYGMASSDIGYIYLSGFKENATDDIRKALDDLKKNNNLKGLILDLRNNPGGLLIEAVRLANLFIDKGELIVSTKGKVESWNKEYRTMEPAYDKNIPLVVLANANSASASEIVAGSLQDLDRAVIIGQRTLGKGLVQTTRPLSYNTQLKVTTSKYYIPSGRCIQEIDYGHRDRQGNAIKVADSLVKQFTTRNGRPVTDGKGIMPDIKIEPYKYPEILNSLLSDRLIFEWATRYRANHSQIPEPGIFTLSDAEYDSFISFVRSKKLNYKTPTEKALEGLKKKAEEDRYLNLIASDIDVISKKLEAEKDNEINIYRADIKKYLEQEIITRYYYQKGRIKAGIKNDPEVKEALRILGNQAEYKKILNPQ